MAKLWDKIILLMIIFMFFILENDTVMTVAAMLCALVVSLAAQYFEKNKKAVFVLQVGYIVLCFVDPYFCLAAPLVLYDILYGNKIWLVIPMVLSVLVYLDFFDYRDVLFLIMTVCITILMQRRTARDIYAKNKLVEIRDRYEEINLLLREKNDSLSESWDYEIYLATLKERNRIAREMHDNVGHMLTRTILQVGALKVINKDENQKEALENIGETLNSAMTSIRQSVHDLHDESVDLKLSLNEMIKSVSERFKIKSELDFSEDMPSNIKFAIIGIAKEALNNAVKYSKGDSIMLCVIEQPAFYQLIVEDNGINKSKISGNGIGIANMRDRVDGLGGILRITSSEKGFKVFVSIPKER